ncbi:PAS domain S-box protein [Lamprobacter modestohalophilus]|uniref:PAS domain S-box protein n=1 Tax=Lamprobacter modestohalophilus TaxID=1064514 RepID=UPI002ADEF72E|nr:PAS domain S-box protein [Lamprobacter modestohalophilus]MEA1052958.1 PAS domain S-box protein [Lamprobacter modestohalophilus]
MRLSLGELSAETAGFRADDGSLLSEALRVDGATRGRIDLLYRNIPGEDDQEPFVRTARTILHIVTQLLALALGAPRRGIDPESTQIDGATFRRLVDQSPAVAFVWSLTEGWPVAFVADSVRQFGYQPHEFLDGSVQYADIVHPDDLARVTKEVQSYTAAGMEDFRQRYRIRTRDGRVRWVYDWTRVLRDARGRAEQNQGIILDITDRVRSEERASRYVATAGNAFIALDRAGKVIAVNEKTCELTGETADNLVGGDWIDEWVSEQGKADAREVMTRILRQQPGWTAGTYDNVIVSRQGQRRHIHWNYACDLTVEGALDQVIAFGADVTELVESKLAAEDMARFQQENPNPVLRIDQHGQVLNANPAARKLFETLRTASAEQQQRWADLVTLSSKAQRSSRQVLAVGEQLFEFTIVPIPAQGYANLYGQDITEQAELHQRIEKLAAHLPGVICQYQQWPDGRAAFPYASQGIKTVYGVEPSEVLDDATPMFRVLHPEDRERIKDSILRSFRHLHTWHERYRVQFQDGRTLWLEGKASPEPQPDASVLWHGYIHDITADVLAAQRLEESQQKLLEAQYIARMGDFDWEIATGKVTWSDGLYRLLGYDPNETIDFAKVQTSIHHPGDLQRITQWLQDSIASDADKLAANEYRLLRKDGSVIEVQTEGWITRQDDEATRIFGICLDITKRKRAEAQLQLAASVFAHSREGILITDAEKHILQVNPGFSRITGYPESEVLGQTPAVLSSGRHDAAFYARMWQSLHEAGFWKGEIWNRRQNGEVFPEMLSVSAVRDANGAIQHYIGVFSDISQIKAQEAKLDSIANYDHLTGVPNRRLLTDCPFDQWYLGLGRDRFGDLEEFQSLGESHARLHRLVAELASRSQTPASPANAAFDHRQLEMASEALMADLQRLMLRIQDPDATGMGSEDHLD